MGALAALLLAALLAALAYLLRLLRSLVWVPHRLERRLRRQGIRGPPRSLLYGNAAEYGALIAAHSAPLASFHHAFVGRAAPEYRDWTAQYGRPFVFWFGPRPRLVVSGPEVAKAVLTDSTGAFRKGSGSNVNPLSRQLLGEGLVALTGEKWAHHRRVISPAFNMERIKAIRRRRSRPRWTRLFRGRIWLARVCPRERRLRSFAGSCIERRRHRRFVHGRDRYPRLSSELLLLSVPGRYSLRRRPGSFWLLLLPDGRR